MKIACHSCETVVDVPVSIPQIQDWRGGTHIQDAMPNLTNDEREMLISRTCGTCWDEMFGEEDDE